MSTIAFELREDAKETSGASAAFPDGKTFDIIEALDNGGGQIVLNPSPDLPEQPTFDGQPEDEEESQDRADATEKWREARDEEIRRAATDAQVASILELHPALKTARPKANVSDVSLDSLKKRASELEIEGRSNMDKEQLASAIAEAEAGSTDSNPEA